MKQRRNATLTIGPSGCGKSTWAKQQHNVEIVCRDDIRLGLLSEQAGIQVHPRDLWKRWKFTNENENAVTRIHLEQCLQAYKDGKDVICADTNLSRKNRDKLTKTLQSIGFTVIEKPFFVSLETCLLWDSQRETKVGKRVIEQQYEKFMEYLVETGQEKTLAKSFMDEHKLPYSETELVSGFDVAVRVGLHSDMPVSEREIYKYFALLNSHLKVHQDESLAECVLIDLDGTAYTMVNRTAFEWMKVNQDSPVEDVFMIANMFATNGVKVIFFSGRDSECRELTISTIKRDMKRFGFSFDWELYMRSAKDQRGDDFVKLELYNNHIRGKYFVRRVLDDRSRVLRLWQYLGFETLILGNPFIHF